MVAILDLTRLGVMQDLEILHASRHTCIQYRVKMSDQYIDNFFLHNFFYTVRSAYSNGPRETEKSLLYTMFTIKHEREREREREREGGERERVCPFTPLPSGQSNQDITSQGA